MICFPNAKINLGLSIIDKRADGMHNIETCMMPVPVYDILEIKSSKEFSIVNSGIPISSNTEDNIISKTWEQLISINKKIPPVDVFLYKNIPIGSGLGGGSSDAAFFLKAINKLVSLQLSFEEMEGIMKRVGADSPFFIRNETAIATGVGDMLCPIENPLRNMYITIVYPNTIISTDKAYSRFEMYKNELSPVSTDCLRSIIAADINDWKNELKNDFEFLFLKDFPEISEIKDTLYNRGAIYSSLTGSGSAIYSVSSKPLNVDDLKGKYLTFSFFNQLTL